MTAEDRKQVKLFAQKLLQALREAKLVLHWRKKLRTRADVFFHREDGVGWATSAHSVKGQKR